ncbi:hypothetical protein F511_24707 [Dorcoceras hygrometricum]|uniref:Uncharacterized protein n=1 Tax=Dorcoceras hygrometricum TaxID=472368 RepID=A0A2Z7BJJ1_9LAMI|nr:hypothetical protein F511_24707 [Dorcoceras hygrometricum]
MALVSVQNSLQVNFESVLSFPSRGIVKMFKALESSGLKGFLGCTVVVYEENLQEFFSNARLERNTVIGTIRGSLVVISEEIFASSFHFPTEGLVVLFELLERLVAQMRMEFSDSRVPVHSSCKKKEMKVEYSLLNDIIANTLSQAGSFDSVTQIRFDLMVAIMGGVRINWSKILFRTLKAMAVPSTKPETTFRRTAAAGGARRRREEDEERGGGQECLGLGFA